MSQHTPGPSHKHKPIGSNGCDMCLELWFALPLGKPIILPNRWRRAGELGSRECPYSRQDKR